MVENFLERLASLIRRLRARRALASVVYLTTVAGLLLAFMCVPWLWRPYLHVPGTTAQFRFDCMPADISIQFVDSHASIASAELAAVFGPSGDTTLGIVGFSPAQEDDQAKLTLPVASLTVFTKLVATTPNVRYVLALTLRGAAAVSIDNLTITHRGDLVGAQCQSASLTSRDLLKAQLNPRAALVRIRPIQMQISNLVLDHNERVGNLLVGAMTMTTVFLHWSGRSFLAPSPFRKRLFVLAPDEGAIL
jgi:hypothetical protein